MAGVKFQVSQPATPPPDTSVASDEVAGDKYQIVKLDQGALGASSLVTAANPLAVTVGNFPATQPISGAVSVSNLPATQPVSGTVGVNNFPATYPVTDNGGSLTVDGPVTDAQLRASAVLSALRDEQIGRTQRISPIGGAIVEQTTRLVGTNFNGSLSNGSADNFWTTGRGTAATSVIGSQIATLTGGTTNSDWCSVQSNRKGRFLFANPNLFRALVRFQAVAAANTTTYIGAIATTSGAPQSGYCFAVSGTGAISVQSYTGGSAVLNKASGFNGSLGGTYSVPDANMHAYEIVYFGAKVWYFIDGALLHSEAPTTAVFSAMMTNNISVSVVNGTSPTSRVVECLFASILRMGKEVSRPQHTYIAANATTLLKTGAGTIHTVIIGNGTVGTITFYDALSATGTPIAVLSTINSTPPGPVQFGIDFFTGLTVVTSAATQITVVYD